MLTFYIYYRDIDGEVRYREFEARDIETAIDALAFEGDAEEILEVTASDGYMYEFNPRTYRWERLICEEC